MNKTDKNPFSIDGRERTKASPGQMGSLLHITHASTFLLGVALMLMVGAFVVWGFLGKVSDKAHYTGVVFPASGTTDVMLPNQGVVRSMIVHSGDPVTAGQPVALVSVGESYSILSSSVSGTVLSTKMDNEAFEAFEPIVSIIGQEGSSDDATAVVIAFTDNATRRDLRVGMEAQVWPQDESRDEIGYIRGVITGVDPYPMSAEEAKMLFRNPEIIATLMALDGPAYRVTVELKHMKGAPSQYDWSFGVPYDVDMGVGTYCSILTETRTRSIFEYLFERGRTLIRAAQLQVE
jgi:hypothetical protein